jgi:hypothetical protein
MAGITAGLHRSFVSTDRFFTWIVPKSDRKTNAVTLSERLPDRNGSYGTKSLYSVFQVFA